MVPWLPGLAASPMLVSPGWRGPEACTGTFVMEDFDTIATMLRYDCLTPLRRSSAIPLVPPYLSSPRFDGWIDLAGPRAFPGGAVVTRWTPHGGCTAILIRDF